MLFVRSDSTSLGELSALEEDFVDPEQRTPAWRVFVQVKCVSAAERDYLSHSHRLCRKNLAYHARDDGEGS